MGFVRKGGGGGGGGGSGDFRGLDGDALRRCSTCRRELLPWQETCPDDGGAAVLPGDIAPDHDELLARLLGEDADEAADADAGVPDEGPSPDPAP